MDRILHQNMFWLSLVLNQRQAANELDNVAGFSDIDKYDNRQSVWW